MRRFEFIDDSSSKFWEMDYTEGGIIYGRIGTDDHFAGPVP